MDISAEHALETMESLYRVYITDPKTRNSFAKTVAFSKE
jgi:hypothetical protein